MNQNRVRSFAISIDPSLTGDRKKNDELRKKSCGTCGYPRAQSGELCGICEEKAIADPKTPADGHRLIEPGGVEDVEIPDFE